ncbi:MarC family protein [Bradyrhizobium brasilense]|uniref:MarC family protein n=1 Tax=Bradyrhizobium brasilense TaxID=1419277 RepID=UPI0024B087AD|nr:MarC family protein [Bradyrhizobium australafricanum]WFU37071.1 MarC family protein [Bradyrhizobium australafricanum]
MGLTDRERARIALRIAVYALVILMSLFVGGHVLRFFGITVPALRIGGRLVVAATGWSMLHAPPVAHDVPFPRTPSLPNAPPARGVG